jgi:hypothetical protein
MGFHYQELKSKEYSQGMIREVFGRSAESGTPAHLLIKLLSGMSEKKQVQRRFSAPVSLSGSMCKLSYRSQHPKPGRKRL